MIANQEELLRKLQEGDDRILASLITLIQNEPQRYTDLLSALFKICTNLRGSEKETPRIYGITGPPGAGKSTLLSNLLGAIQEDAPEAPVGVLLMDPSSPFSGGALLGDRLRMEREISKKHFVRSLGTRGERGGLCRAARDLVRLMIASGKKHVFIETVGVGQVENDIMELADVTVVLLTPDHGDVIQTLKAGLLEIAHVFVVNKADLSGAERMSADLQALDEQRPVFQTIATQKKGVGDLWTFLKTHRDQNKIPRAEDFAREISQAVGFLTQAHVYSTLLHTPSWKRRLKGILTVKEDPYHLGKEVQKHFFPKIGKDPEKP